MAKLYGRGLVEGSELILMPRSANEIDGNLVGVSALVRSSVKAHTLDLIEYCT